MSQRWPILIGVGLIAIGVFMALAKNPSASDVGAHRFRETDSSPTVDVVASNAPVVTGFRGHLKVGGRPMNDGTILPFVIGDILHLECDANNAVEYRWTLDG